jgi:GH24 family phage-related lysozyme (muramidase)
MKQEQDCTTKKEVMPENTNPGIVISKRAVEMIICEEVDSIAHYNKVYCHPTWPGNSASGVTIGIGYDLGYNTREQIIADWRGRIKEDQLQVLLTCSGLKGNAAKQRCANAVVRSIVIPYGEAYAVFVKRSIPRFAKDAKACFPCIVNLQPDAQGALVSLVFNRGSRLTDIGEKENKEKARKEIRDIAKACSTCDYPAIEKSLVNMKRLWDGVPDFEGDKEQRLGGVLRRRDKEAALVKGAVRKYTDDELLKLTV